MSDFVQESLKVVFVAGFIHVLWLMLAIVFLTKGFLVQSL